MMVVLTASQNLKLLDSVDVEDRRRHGKIRSTMISDTGSYQGQIPLTEWSGERNSETNIGAVRPTLSGTDTLNE